MHPDQYTPDSHRYRAADSNPTKPEQDQDSDAIDRAVENDSDEPGSAPEVEGGRQAEAGNAYVGRTMDDSLKANPRVDDPGAGTADSDD